jgi:hypothetical protein
LTGRQADRQTDRQIKRETGKQTGKQIVSMILPAEQTCAQTYTMYSMFHRKAITTNQPTNQSIN